MADEGNILMVLTSQHQMGDSQKLTGFHFEEMSTPYYLFENAGFHVTIASIKGGRPPHDPNSVKEDDSENPESVRRFLADEIAQEKLSNTPPIASLNPADYDAIYLPGGHGTMWDLANEQALVKTIEAFNKDGKPIAAVCHGPAGLLGARAESGEPLVKGKRINCFTDAEEKKVGLDTAMPFLLESELRRLGAKFENADPFEPCLVVDGNLITGQNPPSAKLVADELIRAVQTQRAPEPA